MTTPNFKPGVGRLATDRFDFEKHVNGADFTHDPTGIKLDPSVDIYKVTGVVSVDNLQDAMEAISSFTSQPVLDATGTVKGIIKLSGDLSTGSASSPKVSGLQGYQVNSTAPTNGQVLTYNSSAWAPLDLPDATGTVKGIIKLSGDLSTGSASSPKVSGLQGYQVNSTAPTNGQVLTYNGSAWAPSNLPRATNTDYGLVRFQGDLNKAGADGLAKVVQLTGDGSVGSATVTSKAQKIMFDSSLSDVGIFQESTYLSNGADLYLEAQSNYSGSFSGGNIYLYPGAGSNGGHSGKITLDLVSTEEFLGKMLEISELVMPDFTRGRVVSFFAPTGINTTDLGSTVDSVIYIGNSTYGYNPTASPQYGALLYSVDGKLYTYQQDGYNFSLDSEPNPKSKVVLGTNSNVQIIKWSGTARSNAGSSVDIFSYIIPNKSYVLIKGSIIGSYYAGLLFVNDCFDVNVGWSYKTSGTATRATTIANEFVFISDGGASDTDPSSSATSNVVTIKTGSAVGYQIDWSLNIEIHIHTLR